MMIPVLLVDLTVPNTEVYQWQVHVVHGNVSVPPAAASTRGRSWHIPVVLIQPQGPGLWLDPRPLRWVKFPFMMCRRVM
jgi:hypothetical protein